ncbi:MAG TPA: ABC transporter ATP-binding protein [Trueperaceae bacterium]|nr:ABC transporter ATP-binding protein [Trueperaceae bacterium]
MALLEVSGLISGYGDAVVLKGIDLKVEEGEIVAVVGSNGAGKTTLLRTLSGAIATRGGEVRFAGNRATGITPDEAFGRGLVQVPEGRQLFDRMSVEDNLRMGAFRRNDRRAVGRDFAHVYELFPVLGERRRQLAGSLSGGEQQMCAMARGLMAAPRLLMVDEMSLGLAPVIVERLLQVLTDIQAQGVTVLLVEQDVNSALSVADRGYVLERGEVALGGGADELLGDPRVKEAYLGL